MPRNFLLKYLALNKVSTNVDTGSEEVKVNLKVLQTPMTKNSRLWDAFYNQSS